MNANEHNNSVLTIQSDKNSKKKFKEWENILVGKDIHSIRSQVYDMVFDYAIFQCINESRKYAAEDDEGNIKQNRMLHYFINQSFFKTQLLAIRRLVDRDFNRVQRNKPHTVYSLYNLIEDIKKHSALLTRKNVFATCNLPYNYEKALAEYMNSIDHTKPYLVPQEIAHSEDLHRRIDSAASIAAEKRSPDDLISINNLKQFEIRLNDIEELCKYVDKYIAHSATSESRKNVPEEIEGALGKVLNAHRIICETASYIGNRLLFCGFGSFLSGLHYGKFDQFDVFEYLDEPIASKETIEKLREFWQKYKMETEQWNQL
jgi:hypothetical protein